MGLRVVIAFTGGDQLWVSAEEVARDGISIGRLTHPTVAVLCHQSKRDVRLEIRARR